MRIAVDALGGDHAPAEIVAGAVRAAERTPDEHFVLVGDEAKVRPLLRGAPGNVGVRDARGVIEMGQDPAGSLRARPDSSVAVAAGMVRAGEADAFFSAGSTGATVAAALLKVGRMKGCRRPAIATVLPFEEPVLLLDAGATLVCKPQDLLNFAILGGVFARRHLGTGETPRVGLINVGEEPGKGDDLRKEAHGLLAASAGAAGYRFVGNLEGRDVGRGLADVLVTDGFTGNVVLKNTEGVARETFGIVRGVIGASVAGRLAGSLLRPRLRAVRDRLDPESYGGSFLLGVRAPVLIGHGNSRARGVKNALLGLSRSGTGLIEESERVLAAAGSVDGKVAGGEIGDAV